MKQVVALFVLCLLTRLPLIAASAEQVGNYAGTLKMKGIDPVSGAKLTTKSQVLLTIAEDNSTTLTIDGTHYLGSPIDNLVSADKGNLFVATPVGRTCITAPFVLKNGSIKGTALSIALNGPNLGGSGKFKLKKTADVVNPPSHIRTLTPTGTPVSILSFLGAFSSLSSDAPGFVGDLEVRNLNVTHGATGELSFILTSPSGKMLNIISFLGGNNANFVNTNLDDEALLSITPQSNPFTGTFQADLVSLNVFDGEPIAGTWTLSIISGAVTGSLDSWSLRIVPRFF